VISTRATTKQVWAALGAVYVACGCRLYARETKADRGANGPVAAIQDVGVVHLAGRRVGLAETGQGVADDDAVQLTLHHRGRVDRRPLE